MRADAGLHADPTRRQIGEPGLHLATRPLLPQHDGTALILANDVERVLADIDADHGDRGIGCLRHGVLLVFGAPCQLRLLAGAGPRRACPLTSIRLNSRCTPPPAPPPLLRLFHPPGLSMPPLAPLPSTPHAHTPSPPPRSILFT